MNGLKDKFVPKKLKRLCGLWLDRNTLGESGQIWEPYVISGGHFLLFRGASFFLQGVLFLRHAKWKISFRGALAPLKENCILLRGLNSKGTTGSFNFYEFPEKSGWLLTPLKERSFPLEIQTNAGIQSSQRSLYFKNICQRSL